MFRFGKVLVAFAILVAGLIGIGGPVLLHAQQNQASITGQIASQITTNGNNQITAQTLRLVLNAINNSVFQFSNPATPPVITSCGTSPVLGANSATAGGTFTTGTATPTTCTITFGLPYTTWAVCVVAPANAASSALGHFISAQSITGFTLTMNSGTNSAAWNYNCEGQ